MRLRIPAGWVPRDIDDEHEVAVLPADDDGEPAGVLTVTPLPGDDRSPAETAADALGGLHLAAGENLLVLDAGPVRCRGNTPAYRVLLAHTQRGRGVTTELWVVGGTAPAALCAAVSTARYAELAPVLHRALRSYRA